VPDDPAIDTRIDPARVVATTAGATAAAPPVTLSEPTGVVDDAQFVGRWRISGSISTAGPPGSPRGSGGGGAIGWMREYELRADHTFQMNAYPSLTLRGTWRRVGTTGARAELVHADSRRPDGTPVVDSVTGLAEAGQPLRVLEIGGGRYPRVEVAPPPAMPGDPTQPTRTP
jgi:hypothetical protein